jgi:hypothetical protein
MPNALTTASLQVHMSRNAVLRAPSAIAISFRRSSGVGLLLHEGDTPVRLKGFHLDDDDLRTLVRRARQLRGLPAGPVGS